MRPGAIRWTWWHVVVGAIAAVMALAAWVSAQTARIELYSIDSTTLTDQQFLTGVREGKPVSIGAELRLPLGTGRLPAVLLVHGSGGVGANVDMWAHELNDSGFAAFIIDSFTSRGLVTTITDQAQLGRLAMIIDIYRAQRVLSKHPRIDPARIALMGFSRGGQAVLYASLQRFQRMHAAVRPFAAYIPFYPPCNTTFRGDTNVSGPIRIFHGAADNYVPVAPCRAYVARLRAAGRDVQLTEYPGAYHAFDNPLLTSPVVLKRAQTTRNCALEENPLGQIMNSQTKRIFTYDDPCVEFDPTVAFNAAATEDAVKSVKAFLRGRFREVAQ